MIKHSFGKPKSSPQKLKRADLTKINELTKTRAELDGYVYLDAKKAPFVIGGIINPDENGGEYYRLDPQKRQSYSEANRGLAEHTSGGSIRFATDASKISLRIYNRSSSVGMHHFCDRGVWGVDAYIGTGTNRVYVGAQMQTFANDPKYNEGTLDLGRGVKEVQINLPLYGGIQRFEIGFPRGTRVGAPTQRTNGAVAFYGSSITQGGCVSRPANAYTNIICRALDADCVSYGFSGSAMGELAVADHIASRSLACFVMDYDFNSPSVEHLKATHEPFFKRIRERQPNLPVVFVTHPYYYKASENDLARVAVVKQTYENALAAGDKNVYFVDSAKFFTKEMRDLFAVDILHPNDLGQYSMAETIFPVVKKAIENSKSAE